MKPRYREIKLSADDQLVIRAMAEYPLKKGQMLIVSPEMAAILTGRVLPDGKPQGKIVYDKEEWNR